MTIYIILVYKYEGKRNSNIVCEVIKPYSNNIKSVIVGSFILSWIDMVFILMRKMKILEILSLCCVLEETVLYI